ncbi:MAG: hypothetical protein Unbinned706contig1000_20 [Prokaryotic dsDNA virus sp.]|nr:MAG: hypothetical protein Unbinned706contig1000_20 [Prokaryotic dsDNA virus sp.]
MNKTIMDAVIEFKGEFDYTDLSGDRPYTYQVIVAVSDFEGYKCGDITTGASVSDNQFWKVICTVEEFKSLVNLLASNMGNGNMYELSNYRDEISLGNVPVASKENQPPEQAAPVYTQEMCDAGELPSVGMECSFDTTFFTKVTSNKGTCEILAYHAGKVWINIIDLDCVINLDVIEFKPLPTPIELIDGKAYQFDYDVKSALYGIYNKLEGKFVLSNSSIYTCYCANIKPLTVEGE